MKTRLTAWLAAVSCGLIITLQGCYPGGPEIVGEYDLVATSYDRDFDFSRARTFLMPDSVIHLTPGQVSRAYDPFILQAVASQLRARGFTRLTEGGNQQADVVILTSVTGNTNVSVWQNPYDYWGWYSGWGGYPGFGAGIGPGWGYGYPGYFSPVTVSAYRTGTLVIQMVNPNQASAASQTVPSVWVATFNGLLEGSPASIRDRIVQGINQAFVVSPYLGGSQ